VNSYFPVMISSWENRNSPVRPGFSAVVTCLGHKTAFVVT
jgi:hypothetical protein